jgi:rhodanese-related sulfurtransferase
MDAEAIAHFAAKLRFETDSSDVRAAQLAGDRFVLVDSRGDAAWAHGRIEGAVHLPTARIAAEAVEVVPAGLPVVVYCWGPGCNGSTRAALEFARLGVPVREMIGGYEYWTREGLPTVTDAGPVVPSIDPLTAPSHAVTCSC